MKCARVSASLMPAIVPLDTTCLTVSSVLRISSLATSRDGIHGRILGEHRAHLRGSAEQRGRLGGAKTAVTPELTRQHGILDSGVPLDWGEPGVRRVRTHHAHRNRWRLPTPVPGSD